MRARRGRKFLVEPPASATGDIAFNLIVFFLVCASVQPDSGRHQTLPRSEEIDQQQEKMEKLQQEKMITLSPESLLEGTPIEAVRS